MEESPRRRARELVLKRLYAAEIGEIESDDVLENVVDERNLGKKNYAFSREYFLLVRKKSQWADTVITELAENWDVERIAAIDRIIIRMALVELTEMPDVPVKVVINEAIELGKKYSTHGSSAFINGILDSFARNNEKGERS
jgi:transcription antitermination factor NusB